MNSKQEVLLSSLSLWLGCGCVGVAVAAVAVVLVVSSAVSMSSSCSSHPSSYSWQHTNCAAGEPPSSPPLVFKSSEWVCAICIPCTTWIHWSMNLYWM